MDDLETKEISYIQTCRVCLEIQENNRSLFDVVELVEKIRLVDVLTKVVNIKILHNDDVGPNRICNDCMETLLIAYQFVCRVEKSESILQDQIVQNNESVKDLEYLYDATECEEIEVLDDDFQELLEENKVIACDTHSETEQKFEKVKSHSSESFDEGNHGDISSSQIQDDAHYLENENIETTSPLSESQRSVNTKKFIRRLHKCNQCNRNFARHESLKRHMNIAHTYAPPEKIAAVVASIPNPPEENFNCSYCPRNFARKGNLIRHVSTVHNVNEDQEEIVEAKKTYIYKRRICPYCGQSFSQASLIVHIRRHTGETPYKCEYCNKGFPRRQELIIHQRNHTGERPHVCSVCGKTFSRPNKLARHMRIHTGERPYKCTECDRSFSQSNDLNIHIRRHTGEKPYICDVCGDAFISGSLLKSHCKQKEHEIKTQRHIDPYEKIRVKNRYRKI